jgi:lipid A disaccharide synthetase
LGSRKKEVERLMPVFLKLAGHFKEKKILVSNAFGYIKNQFNQFPNVEIRKENAKKIIPLCRVAIACNGTLVQQCVVSKTPVVAVYKTSNLFWNILGISKLLGKTPDFWVHPNIFAEREVVPERIQNLCNFGVLEKDVNDMWANKSKYVNKFLKISKKYNSGSTFAKSIESIKALVNE